MTISEPKYRLILSHPLPAWCSLLTGKAKPLIEGCYSLQKCKHEEAQKRAGIHKPDIYPLLLQSYQEPEFLQIEESTVPKPKK